MSSHVDYLRDRLRRVYDDLGNGRRAAWSLRDATAVHGVLDELAAIAAAANSEPGSLQTDTTPSRHPTYALEPEPQPRTERSTSK